VVEAGLGHAFAEAAFLDEVLLKAAALLVEEVVGLVDGAGFLRGFVPLGQPVASKLKGTEGGAIRLLSECP